MQVLSPKEIAKLYRISYRTALRWLQEGHIEGQYIAGRWYVPIAEKLPKVPKGVWKKRQKKSQ